MKIVYLHQYFTTPSMTGGTRSYEMARRLVSAGHEVHMVTSTREGGEKRKGWQLTHESGIHVHWYPVPYCNKMSFRKRIKAFFTFAIVAAIKSASIKADVVFATSTPLTIALPAIYAAKRNKIPMVFEVRDLWPEIPIAIGALKHPFVVWCAKKLEKFAYRNAKCIVALSPGMRDGIVSAGYPEDQISVVPNSSDVELFSVSQDKVLAFRNKYSWLQSRPLVVYCGTIGFINGVGYLADLAKAVFEIDPEVRFVVVGEGVEEEQVRCRAIEVGVLNKNFFMLSKVSKSDIAAIVKAADLATSVVIDKKELWHNSANKFFDAFAAGVPIAINYEGWQADILRNKNAGIVLNPNDFINSAQMLSKALHDKEWMNRARINASRLAREEFSRDLLFKKLECVLNEAVQK